MVRADRVPAGGRIPGGQGVAGSNPVIPTVFSQVSVRGAGCSGGCVGPGQRHGQRQRHPHRVGRRAHRHGRQRRADGGPGRSGQHTHRHLGAGRRPRHRHRPGRRRTERRQRHSARPRQCGDHGHQAGLHTRSGLHRHRDGHLRAQRRAGGHHDRDRHPGRRGGGRRSGHPIRAGAQGNWPSPGDRSRAPSAMHAGLRYSLDMRGKVCW